MGGGKFGQVSALAFLGEPAHGGEDLNRFLPHGEVRLYERILDLAIAIDDIGGRKR